MSYQMFELFPVFQIKPYPRPKKSTSKGLMNVRGLMAASTGHKPGKWKDSLTDLGWN